MKDTHTHTHTHTHIPVSYTHLDVYKRQILDRSFSFDKFMHEIYILDDVKSIKVTTMTTSIQSPVIGSAIRHNSHLFAHNITRSLARAIINDNMNINIIPLTLHYTYN